MTLQYRFIIALPIELAGKIYFLKGQKIMKGTIYIFYDASTTK